MEGSSVYLDACCFIEAVKSDSGVELEAARKTEVWYIKKLLQAHRDRELTVYTSALSIAEATHIGDVPVPKQVQQRFDALLTNGQYVYLVEPTPFICIDARDLRWTHGINLRGADSAHLASALDRSCAEFITMNGRFKKVAAYTGKLRQLGIVACVPSATNALPGKYLQMDWTDVKTPPH